ncbi:TonB-dependent receptor [Phenylobacterium sp. LjRoot225]|uniref:TonB-dependent receptor domain-containing protein n=1 Tax=Phenylobacterium sp. LjRoot225 TaxID=3342285 RepID=UPI003ECD7794
MLLRHRTSLMFPFVRSLRLAMCASVATIALAPVYAVAQEAAQTAKVDKQAAGGVANASEESSVMSEIVVTGTLLRGAPPVGSNLISVGQEKITSTGATTANELLASVPQVSNLFNNVATARLGVAANQIQVARPNLRNLAGETSSSASTLVLFDGHRIAPVGVTQNAIDPDILPPIAIERVEVVTDGGSATYGSDAVGGVINFITRKRFDGLKTQAHYGFADNYKQYDAGVMAGKDWGSGSIFAAYNYQHNSALFGRDRDFIRDVDWLSPNLTPRGRVCLPANVQITGTPNVFALPGLTSTTPNACDYGNGSVVPSSTRHGALVGLHQELTDWLTADFRVFYGQRKATSFGDWTSSATVTSSQFYYTPVPGQSPTARETVFFNLSPLLGRSSLRSGSEIKEWGANSEFDAKLNDNWRLRTLFNFSESESNYHFASINNTLLNQFATGTTAATSINFYNPGAGANDLANIQRLINSEQAAQGKESLTNIRPILDGTLWSWAGGDIKLAVGYEYMHDSFRQAVVLADQPVGTLATTPFVPYSRNIHSAFGELNVPIVGEGNRMPFIYSLTLAGSVRYDHFSDFGGTTNPKVGVNFKPVSWLGFRGNYSTSFNAPSPVDQLGSLKNSFFGGGFVPFNAFVKPGDVPRVSGLLAIQGSTPNLRPQTAKTWSVGFDIDPPVVEGLHASANYYNVKFKNIIGQPTPNAGIFANFPNNVVSNVNGVTLTQLQNFVNGSGVPNAAAVLARTTPLCNQATGICPIYELIDFRSGNYGTLDIEGLDFTVNYRKATDFGGIDASVSGNYTLDRTSQTGAGAPVIDELHPQFRRLPGGTIISTNGASRLQLSATVGADVGNFRAQVTLNHSSGYGVTRCDTTTTTTLVCNPSATGAPTATGLPQDRVHAFNTVNLFFKYDVPDGSMLPKDLKLTLNINNLFDTDPPVFKSIGSSTPGYANGFTLGRLVQFGVHKDF